MYIFLSDAWVPANAGTLVSVAMRQIQGGSGRGWWVGGKFGEPESAGYDGDAGPGVAIQRTPVQGNADNHRREATILGVL